MPKARMTNASGWRPSLVIRRASSLFRHSDFVIRHCPAAAAYPDSLTRAAFPFPPAARIIQ
jgi:hypothetical protein